MQVRVLLGVQRAVEGALGQLLQLQQVRPRQGNGDARRQEEGLVARRPLALPALLHALQQPPPVAQENASDVQQNIIQNTGPEGEGSYDSTGAFLLSTEQQIIERGKVGDKVTPALAAELQAFADGR